MNDNRRPGVPPPPESYWGHVNPIGPRSGYDEGQRCAETLFFDYRRQHGLPIKVARMISGGIEKSLWYGMQDLGND